MELTPQVSKLRAFFESNALAFAEAEGIASNTELCSDYGHAGSITSLLSKYMVIFEYIAQELNDARDSQTTEDSTTTEQGVVDKKAAFIKHLSLLRLDQQLPQSSQRSISLGDRPSSLVSSPPLTRQRFSPNLPRSRSSGVVIHDYRREALVNSSPPQDRQQWRNSQPFNKTARRKSACLETNWRLSQSDDFTQQKLKSLENEEGIYSSTTQEKEQEKGKDTITNPSYVDHVPEKQEPISTSTQTVLSSTPGQRSRESRTLSLSLSSPPQETLEKEGSNESSTTKEESLEPVDYLSLLPVVELELGVEELRDIFLIKKEHVWQQLLTQIQPEVNSKVEPRQRSTTRELLQISRLKAKKDAFLKKKAQTAKKRMLILKLQQYSSAMRKSPFVHFSVELTLYTFSQLEGADLGRLCQCCKLWREMIYASEQLWEQLCYRAGWHSCKSESETWRECYIALFLRSRMLSETQRSFISSNNKSPLERPEFKFSEISSSNSDISRQSSIASFTSDTNTSFKLGRGSAFRLGLADSIINTDEEDEAEYLESFKRRARWVKGVLPKKWVAKSPRPPSIVKQK
jgi:hypothetical protein